MLKRFVAMLLVAVLCMGVVASAEEITSLACPHNTWKVSNTTTDTVTRDEYYHDIITKLYIVCAKCGRFMNIEQRTEAKFHSLVWVDYHAHLDLGNKHVFIRTCNPCGYVSESHEIECSGNPHVSNPYD